MDAQVIKAPRITHERERELFSFQEKYGLHFNDLRYLNLAFTHTSYANEQRDDVDNNERLEFLGDSVLGMITAEYLFSSFKSLHEGDFSKIKASVVSEESLSEIAIEMGFDKYLLMGHGEELQGGKHKKAVLADAMEAVIAAIRKYTLSFISGQIDRYLKGSLDFKDYKTQLQEYLQKRKKMLPQYRLVSQSGPDHNQEFAVAVKVLDKEYGPASGKNKKSAEQKAAKLALTALGLIR